MPISLTSIVSSISSFQTFLHSDPAARASFVAEISLLKSLRHPNVLRFVGIFCKDSKVRPLPTVWRAPRNTVLLKRACCSFLAILLACLLAYLHACLFVCLLAWIHCVVVRVFEWTCFSICFPRSQTTFPQLHLITEYISGGTLEAILLGKVAG